MANPHEQVIETICTDVLPNMVRLSESGRMAEALDRDRFVTLVEEKIERANKSLKMLPPQDQERFRTMIDQAYATTIDRIREHVAVRHAIPVQNTPAEPRTI